MAQPLSSRPARPARPARAAKPAPASRVRDEARALYRKAILDAAEDVFAERGVASARVQDIAIRARLAVGTIYNHFEQKEDVLFALLSERTMGFLDAFQASKDDPPAFGDQLVARMIRLIEYIGSHRAFFDLATDHGLFGGTTGRNDESAELLLGGRKIPHAGRFEQAVLALVNEGVSKGALASGPRALLAFHLRGTIRSAAQWMRVEDAGVTAEHAVRASVSLFLHGASTKSRAQTAPRARRRRATDR